MRIGLDAMGGDFAPRVTVEGAAAALEFMAADTTIVLFGDRDQIMSYMPSDKVGDARLEIVHTSEVIEMGDHPAKAFQQKADSSITVGFMHLHKGLIDGFASAGSTGAMMVGSMFTVKQIEGIIRPTIATHIKTPTGGRVTLLDVGLNSDCKPEVLYQYGIIGSIYCRGVLGVENPRVALLNIGSEPEKGNILCKATYPLMENSTEFNFVGNVEGNDIFEGSKADIVVCDGFTGNVVIKMAESIYEIFKKQGSDTSLVEGFNYEQVGGTPILGINSNVIIGHGCSTAEAIKNMVRETERTVKADLISKFKTAFAGKTTPCEP